MRVRLLQRLDQDQTWFNDAYAYEDEAGQVIFRHSLAWERLALNATPKYEIL